MVSVASILLWRVLYNRCVVITKGHSIYGKKPIYKDLPTYLHCLQLRALLNVFGITGMAVDIVWLHMTKNSNDYDLNKIQSQRRMIFFVSLPCSLYIFQLMVQYGFPSASFLAYTPYHKAALMQKGAPFSRRPLLTS